MLTVIIIDLVLLLLLLFVGCNGFVPTIIRSRGSYSSSTMYMSIQQNNIAKYIGFIAIAGGMTFGSPSYGDSLKSGLSEYKKVVESQSSLSLSSTEILEPKPNQKQIYIQELKATTSSLSTKSAKSLLQNNPAPAAPTPSPKKNVISVPSPAKKATSISSTKAGGDTVVQLQRRVWFDFSGRLTDTELAIDGLRQDIADTKIVFVFFSIVSILVTFYRMDESEKRMEKRMDESEKRMEKRMDESEKRMEKRMDDMFIVTSTISLIAVLVSVFKK
jgi:hypothetical protein